MRDISVLHKLDTRFSSLFPQYTYSLYPPATPADWSREVRGKRVIAPASLNDYLMVFTRRDSEKAHDFISTLMRVGPPMGMRVGKPTMVELPNDKTDVLVDHIASNLVDETTQMVRLLSVTFHCRRQIFELSPNYTFICCPYILKQVLVT